MMDEDKLCVVCGKGETDGDNLNQVGRFWNQENEKEHPLNTLITLAKKCDLKDLSSKLISNKTNNIITYIHKSCRTNLRNQSRKRKSSDEPGARSSKRICGGVFDFKKLCFYCEKPCEFDRKHPDRFKMYFEVRTLDTDIHKETLDMCNLRNDETAMNVQRRLLSVKDLVAPEARYHVECRVKFENSTNRKTAAGRPVSSTKLELFEQACTNFLENDIELYTVTEFHEMMATLGDEVYSVKMTQNKLSEKYKGCINFVSRQGKSNIILLDRAAEVLSEKWYSDRQKRIGDETARIVQTAAVLLKENIKNHKIDSTTYPSCDDIRSPTNHTPNLLTLLLNGLFTSSIKEATISQAIVAATRPKTIMPLQFGLAISTDNQIGSKWLNILLSKLGFAVSYDEVMIL